VQQKASATKGKYNKRQVQQQIPFGDDNKKGKSRSKMRGFFAPLRMTTEKMSSE
jgi:hypothetical protein